MEKNVKVTVMVHVLLRLRLAVTIRSDALFHVWQILFIVYCYWIALICWIQKSLIHSLVRFWFRLVTVADRAWLKKTFHLIHLSFNFQSLHRISWTSIRIHKLWNNDDCYIVTATRDIKYKKNMFKMRGPISMLYWLIYSSISISILDNTRWTHFTVCHPPFHQSGSQVKYIK